MKYKAKDIESLIQAIYDGTVTQMNLPEDLYFAIAEHLKKGLYKGFGGDLAAFEGTDESLALLVDLRENIHLFAAAKTFTQVDDMCGYLIDEEGVIRSFSEFSQLVRPIYEQYNVNWQEAEYNTTIGQAQSAQRWRDISERAAVLPVLRYSCIGDACPICRPLDMLTAPVNSPIWTKIMPLNHFNCFCIVEQHPDGTKLTGTREADEVLKQVTTRMSPVFIGNAGITGEVFNASHPYFDVPDKYRDFARDNFNLPIPKND